MTYTIVIDVDNFRAERAYKKGLDELEEIWPQIEIYCQKKEDAIKPLQEAIRQENKAEWERWQKKDEEKREQRRKWKAWKESTDWFKGPEPERGDRFVLPPLDTPVPTDYARERYEGIHARLKRMYTIANAAIGCYRMTEEDVMEMAGWEDGSRIAKILKEIA